MSTIRTTVYLHSDKETMHEMGVKLGLEGEALNHFRYAGYEVALGMDVDTATGNAVIVAVDGKKVKR